MALETDHGQCHPQSHPSLPAHTHCRHITPRCPACLTTASQQGPAGDSHTEPPKSSLCAQEGFCTLLLQGDGMGPLTKPRTHTGRGKTALPAEVTITRNA